MSIQVFKFNPSDMQDLLDMHRSQGYHSLELINLDTLPEVGFIAKNHNNQPIAAGFLRKLEGGFAQIDTLVSNANCSGSERNDGIDAVVQSLISTGKQLGLLGLVAFTKDLGILSRAGAMGFTTLEDKVITLAF